MQQVGAALRRQGVEAIYLVHGAAARCDASGILAALSRAVPAAGRAGRLLIKRLLGVVLEEVGSYTPAYAAAMESALGGSGEPAIAVRLFRWSGENHHLGRADGAVRLIDELASLKLAAGRRLLVWGHGHGGNVLALLTNLVAGEQQKVDGFFEAAEIYYRWPLVGCVDIPVWQRVREMLAAGERPLQSGSVDLVTFGTPIRYGWDPEGCSRLMHFIYHRPADELPPYRALFPPRLQNVVRAAGGDYVQQLGIAGTNLTPSILEPRAWMADQRLSRLLQPPGREHDPLERFHAGAIVPDEGITLLVDYGQAEGGLAEHLAGHAVYTHRRWMLFHAEEVARRFYRAMPEAA